MNLPMSRLQGDIYAHLAICSYYIFRLVDGNIVSVSLYGDIFDTLKGHHVVTMFKDIKVKLLIH